MRDADALSNYRYYVSPATSSKEVVGSTISATLEVHRCRKLRRRRDRIDVIFRPI
ncbi:MAG: hypothetical protein HRT83_00775 [Hyphomicrobiaceae bacterium]|nr:hypothetical protein [Hyphomicrobiaceae bacterium]